MACDDNCRLFLGKEPNKGPEVVNNTEKILEVWWASNYREYFRVDGQTRGSKWVNMTKGAHYYIETHHVEGGGGDHLNVAVEIKKTAATVVGHHHSLKEVQYLGIESDDKRDTSQIIIDVDAKFDDKEYMLFLLSPTTKQMTGSDKIKVDCSASTMRAALRKYYIYDKGIKSDIDVTKTYYGMNGTKEIVVAKKENATKLVYNVTVRKLIDGPSVSGITVVKQGTKAKITAKTSDVVQASSKPV